MLGIHHGVLDSLERYSQYKSFPENGGSEMRVSASGGGVGATRGEGSIPQPPAHAGKINTRPCVCFTKNTAARPGLGIKLDAWLSREHVHAKAKLQLKIGELRLGAIIVQEDESHI